MKKILSIFILALVTLGCTQPLPDKAHTRYMFDAGGSQVITSFANRQQQTMSVLYGNSAALTSASSAHTTAAAGAVFKLVVYKQRDNKFWYGSYINGRLQSIETVSFKQSGGKAQYILEQGQLPVDSTGRSMDAASRVAYILSHKPSLFP